MSETQRTLLTLEEAAQRAGYSARHLKRIVVRDDIRHLRISGKWFVVQADLASWIRDKSPRRSPLVDELTS
jgi:hypothetical protein